MRRPAEDLDHPALIALGAIALGWFFMSSLVVDFGLWQKSIRFYQVWALIQDPAGQLSGVNGARTLTAIVFGIVCAAALLAPLICMRSRRPASLLTYLLPFVVMAVSGAVLYEQGAMNTVVADSGAHSASAYIARITQAAIGRASSAVASRVSVGAGAYLALLGSCFLVLRGLTKYRSLAKLQSDAGN